MDKLVSIVIPIYNVERYLEQCIESVINQTYKNIEIILVDDGSTDLSGAIADKYSFENDRIRVIHKANGGLSDARNIGKNISRGEFICFVDSDDLISPYYVEKLLYACESTGCEIGICSFVQFSENNLYEVCDNYISQVEVFSSHDALCRMYGVYSIETVVAWNKIYRRCLFDEIEYPKGRIHEDEATTYQLIYRANGIARIDAVLYFYRNNPMSITRKGYSFQHMDILWAIDNRRNYYKFNCLNDLYYLDTYKYLCKLLICYHDVQEYLSDNTIVSEYSDYDGMRKSQIKKALMDEYTNVLRECKGAPWRITRLPMLKVFRLFPVMFYNTMVERTNKLIAVLLG